MCKAKTGQLEPGIPDWILGSEATCNMNIALVLVTAIHVHSHPTTQQDKRNASLPSFAM